ncbi:guanine nucleotide-binding protein subunit gamma 2-like isoform X2 [Camellia sinensis]|uniref:guanine nucleotide-binding protein subunit gamma 2-like isoform X2 n=1 Tax=Camellia sinensis TaxID=4442 RepID=UPI0010367E92|nr:guanine nucleotide-binding protein subunit gamma 2-like isoform X2 [Camellia sinensis]
MQSTEWNGGLGFERKPDMGNDELCIKLVLEELEQLEKIEKASAACKEMLIIVDTKPDPLLPVTTGPTNPSWDRWFEGPQDSEGCRCWIL